MKKRILITSVLSTLIVGFGANAFAGSRYITISGYRKSALGLHTFTYNPTESKPYQIHDNRLNEGELEGLGHNRLDYKTFEEAVEHLEKASKKKSNAIAIDSDSVGPFLTALVNDTDGLATTLYERDKDSGITKEDIQEEAKELLTKKRGGVDFLKRKLKLTSNSIVNEYKKNNNKEITSEELKEVDYLAKKIEAYYIQLTSETPGDEDQINSSNEVRAFRNDSTTQDTLKKAVTIVKNAESSTDADHKAEAKAILDFLEGRSGFFFADPKKTSVADLPDVQKPDTYATNSMLNTSISTSAVLNDRMSLFTGYGVASGDEVERYGAWIKGTFGIGTQRALGSEPGYTYIQKGVTIGVDAGEESMIGTAYSFFQNDMKNKISASAKDEIRTHMFSAYGLYSIQPEFFVSSQASYGMSDIDKIRATGDIVNNKAKAKTKGSTIAARAEAGYVHKIDESMSLVPTIGFGHANVNVDGYSETGDGLNRKIAKRNSSRTSGIAGISFKNSSQADFTQEVHANIDYAFRAKTTETKITVVDGLTNLITPSQKASKAYYNVGGSVKFNYDDILDIIAGYDLGLANKFISNTGTLKLRVNF